MPTTAPGVGRVPAIQPAGPANGQTLLSYAASLSGDPYKWGGTTPSGFDCSGYVQFVFAHYGIKLPRTSQEQATAGVPIAAAQAQPGDLVFFDTSDGTNGHVGIYAGHGLMYDAPNPSETVGLHSIQGYGPSRFVRIPGSPSDTGNTGYGFGGSGFDISSGITSPGFAGVGKTLTDPAGAAAQDFSAILTPILKTVVQLAEILLGVLMMVAGLLLLLRDQGASLPLPVRL